MGPRVSGLTSRGESGTCQTFDVATLDAHATGGHAGSACDPATARAPFPESGLRYAVEQSSGAARHATPCHPRSMKGRVARSRGEPPSSRRARPWRGRTPRRPTLVFLGARPCLAPRVQRLTLPKGAAPSGPAGKPPREPPGSLQSRYRGFELHHSRLVFGISRGAAAVDSRRVDIAGFPQPRRAARSSLRDHRTCPHTGGRRRDRRRGPGVVLAEVTLS